MTTQEATHPAGAPCWADARVTFPARTARFYQELLGWEFSEREEADGRHYLIASVDGREVAAIGPKPVGLEGLTSIWTSYLAVDDVDQACDRIAEAGGQVFFDPGDKGADGTDGDNGPKGRIAWVADPTGASFGLRQMGDGIGAQVTGVPGALAWHECATEDPDRAREFYSQVFGYDVNEVSEQSPRYAELRLDGRPVAGIGELDEDAPDDMRAQWRVYFVIDDVDAAAKKVSELGGTVEGEPYDSRYGRVAAVTDDDGVSFLLLSGDPAAEGR